MTAVSRIHACACKREQPVQEFHYYEAFASIVCGVTITTFSPQIWGSLVAKMKEEELGWLQ
jgi:hypothetical protein